MELYRYTGPGPHLVEGDDGPEAVRPGDVWEFAAEPDWGAWTPLRDGEAAAFLEEREAAKTPAGGEADAPAPPDPPAGHQDGEPVTDTEGA